jgi:phage-related protein
MAINRTGALFKGFTFDSEDSKDYGIYITGEAVFNAPERDVELISIPGRNGSLALDRGRFNNIEVSYPAGFYGDTEADFADAASALRNMLASRPGYCRLEDDYNPDEYRLALYRSGLEISPADLKSGTTEITFECQPQRFLKSGETAIEVEDGDTLTNPTLFESRPMLQVWDYGKIHINEQTIEVFDTAIGETTLYPHTEYDPSGGGYSFDMTADILNVGDEIIIKNLQNTIESTAAGAYKFASAGAASVSGALTIIASSNIYGGAKIWRSEYDVPGDIVISKGTDYSASASVIRDIYFQGGTTAQAIVQVSVVYDSMDNSLTIKCDFMANTAVLAYLSDYSVLGWFSYIRGYSTKTALGSPLYFDLDIGEAYVLEDGAPVSVNNAVSIPAKLPTLKPGANEITFDNTISKLEIIPRWFIV